MASSSASGQQGRPKMNQRVELIIRSDDDKDSAAGRRAAAGVFEERQDNEDSRALLLDVVDSLSDDDDVDGEGDGPAAAAAALPGAGGMPPPKIRVRGLRKRAASTGDEILRGVRLDVPRGVVMGVIGPSGGGKSTLLRALNRLWEPAPGAVFLDGADVCGLDVRALRRKVGMLFQQPAMFDGTVAYNVRYGPQLRGKKLSEDEVQSLLRLADLDPALSSKPANELSVGQQQRVALARTLANDPEVLLLDEPTSALDPISTQNIEDTIVRLKKTRGLTTVIVSHSVKQIQRIADLVCLLVAGEVVEVLAPSELSNAKHPMARRFLELS